MRPREERLAELRPYAERARRKQGWSFDVNMVNLGPPAPWDYDERALSLLSGARVVVDMGTGGGERFSRLCDGYRGTAVATEGWPPNVPVAAARLAPMGVQVVHASGLRLPLADGSIDLVLNRHEELDPPGGTTGGSLESSSRTRPAAAATSSSGTAKVSNRRGSLCPTHGSTTLASRWAVSEKSSTC